VLKNKLSSSHVISHRLVFHLEWHIVSKCCRFIVGESFFVFFFLFVFLSLPGKYTMVLIIICISDLVL